MNLPASPLLVDLFLLEAKDHLEDGELLRAAGSLAKAAAYAGETPPVKVIRKILRMRAKLAQSID